jgi:hypothetical protein
LAGSASSVELVSDLNSQPDDTAGAYGTFDAAGSVDAGVVVHGPAGGFTAGQTELLDNVPSKLDHRIDDVLYQPRGVGAVAAEVLGEELRSQGGIPRPFRLIYDRLVSGQLALACAGRRHSGPSASVDFSVR